MFKLSRNAILFFVGQFLCGTGLIGFHLFFNIYLKEKGFKEGVIGIIITFETMGMALMSLPAAFIAKKLKLRIIFLISILFPCAGFMIAVLSNQFPYILGSVTFGAIFFSFLNIIGAPLIMHLGSEENRTFLFTLNQAVSLVSGMIGRIVAGNLVTFLNRKGLMVVDAYRFVLLLHLLLAISSLLPFLLIKPPKLYGENEEKKEFFKIGTPLVHIIKLLLPLLLVGAGAGFTIPFLNLYFKYKFNLSPEYIGYLFTLSTLFTLGGTFLSPILARKMGKVRTVIFSQLLSIPFLFFLGSTLQLKVAIISFLLRDMLMNMANPLVLNFLLEQVHKNDQYFISAIIGIIFPFSSAITTSIGGNLIDKHGYFIPFSLTILFYSLSTGIFIFLLLPLEKKAK